MVDQVRLDFTDKQIIFLFLAKHYGLEKVSKGWKAIGKDVQTTGQVIDILWGQGLLEGSKGALFKDATPATPVPEYHKPNRITISAAGIKLLDDLCRETGIYFPDGATDWNFADGVWRMDYNYRYKIYSFHKWEKAEEDKTLKEIFGLQEKQT